jgi:hypothetical protein
MSVCHILQTTTWGRPPVTARHREGGRKEEGLGWDGFYFETLKAAHDKQAA